MKMLKKTSLFAAMVGVSLLNVGCDKNDDEKDEHITAILNYSCSEDLLEFVTPVLTYTNENGEKIEIVLNKNDFFKSSIANAEVNVTKDNQTTVEYKTFDYCYYPIYRRYNSIEVKEEMIVRYEVIPEVSIDPNKEYVFYHNFFFNSYRIFNGDLLKTTIEKKKSLTEEHVSGKKEVEDFLYLMRYTTLTQTFESYKKSMTRSEGNDSEGIDIMDNLSIAQ